MSIALGCSDGVATEDPRCAPDLAAFERQVSIPVLERYCVSCHVAHGIAAGSALVLARPTEDEHLQRNAETLREVAGLRLHGQSLLLSKPINAIPHGGGAQISADSPAYEALAAWVARIESGSDCATHQAPEADPLAHVALYDLPETIRRAKLQLVGELPGAAELQFAAENGPEAVRLLVGTYLERVEFYEILKRWANDLLHTDKYLGGDRALDLVNPNDFPDAKFYRKAPQDRREDVHIHSNDAVARAPLELIAHVVRNDRPFTEILTAD